MFGALNRKPVPRVVVRHLRDRHEAPLKVAQAELAALRVAADLHVHETSGAPEICPSTLVCGKTRVLDFCSVKGVWTVRSK